MLRTVIWHLREQFGVSMTYSDPDDYLRSTVVFDIKHFDIGIVQRGIDPRHPEEDPLGELVRRRCFLILYPLSAKHDSRERLNAFAASHDYTTVYFDPMALGHVSAWWTTKDIDEFRERLQKANNKALQRLVTNVIGKYNDVAQLEHERSRRIMPEIYGMRTLNRKYRWPEYLPARAALLLDVLEDIEGLSHAWDIAKHFDWELTADEYAELLQMLHMLEAVGRAKRWRLKWMVA